MGAHFFTAGRQQQQDAYLHVNTLDLKLREINTQGGKAKIKLALKKRRICVFTFSQHFKYFYFSQRNTPFRNFTVSFFPCYSEHRQWHRESDRDHALKSFPRRFTFFYVWSRDLPLMPRIHWPSNLLPRCQPCLSSPGRRRAR